MKELLISQLYAELQDSEFLTEWENSPEIEVLADFCLKADHDNFEHSTTIMFEDLDQFCEEVADFICEIYFSSNSDLDWQIADVEVFPQGCIVWWKEEQP